jgi:hypothetical protein
VGVEGVVELRLGGEEGVVLVGEVGAGEVLAREGGDVEGVGRDVCALGREERRVVLREALGRVQKGGLDRRQVLGRVELGTGGEGLVMERGVVGRMGRGRVAYMSAVARRRRAPALLVVLQVHGGGCACCYCGTCREGKRARARPRAAWAWRAAANQRAAAKCSVDG